MHDRSQVRGNLRRLKTKPTHYCSRHARGHARQPSAVESLSRWPRYASQLGLWHCSVNLGQWRLPWRWLAASV